MTELSRCGGDLEQIWTKLVKCVDDFGGVVQQRRFSRNMFVPKITVFDTRFLGRSKATKSGLLHGKRKRDDSNNKWK